MSLQFVDINADGHQDIVTATFDGSPHVAFGSEKGFKEPVRLKDQEGRRIVISSIWDYDQRKHTNVDYAFDGKPVPDERCISAQAFDWDNDGDFDLLLGSYENGHLYRQMNLGTNQEPKFSGKNIRINAGKGAFTLPAKMTAPRLIDWDGDGDMDLLAGSFGDSYGKGTGGGLYVSVNRGKVGAPRFSALEIIIPASQKGHDRAMRPDVGLYADASDIDGDGDLDLLVGGYSMWQPKARKLSEDEQQALKEMNRELLALQEKSSKNRQAMSNEVEKATQGMNPDSDDYLATVLGIRKKYKKEGSDIRLGMSNLSEKISALKPTTKRVPLVWLYSRN